MRNKIKLLFPTIVFIIFGVYFYLTPYLTVISMKNAADAHDSARFSSYVNFEMLKESLKLSFNAKLASKIIIEEEKNSVATLSHSMATALIEPVIDAFVTPEKLAIIFNRKAGKIEDNNEKIVRKNDSIFDKSMHYKDFYQFVVIVQKKNRKNENFEFIFNRDGFFSWKLSAVNITSLNVEVFSKLN